MSPVFESAATFVDQPTLVLIALLAVPGALALYRIGIVVFGRTDEEQD